MSEMAQQDFFQHRDIDQTSATIRLVKINPLGGELIRCKVQHFVLGCKSYIALSYLWGEDDCEFIVLNNKLFKVQQNLWAFLRVAQQSFPNQWFWIDAICIDQQNLEERNHQVRQMGYIYSMATHVKIWLGCQDGLSSQMSDLANKLLQALPGEKPNAVTAEHAGWRPFVRLCNSPYWRRAWILQEFVLAKERNVLYGDVELSWSVFSTLFLEAITSQDAILRQEAQQSLVLPFVERLELNTKWNAVPLFKLLMDFGKLGCQQSQDRVYSVLALVTERSSIEVNYKASKLDLLIKVLGASSYNPMGDMATLLFDMLDVNVSKIERPYFQSSPVMGTRTKIQSPWNIDFLEDIHFEKNQSARKYLESQRTHMAQSCKSCGKPIPQEWDTFLMPFLCLDISHDYRWDTTCPLQEINHIHFLLEADSSSSTRDREKTPKWSCRSIYIAGQEIQRPWLQGIQLGGDFKFGTRDGSTRLMPMGQNQLKDYQDKPDKNILTLSIGVVLFFLSEAPLCNKGLPNDFWNLFLSQFMLISTR